MCCEYAIDEYCDSLVSLLPHIISNNTCNSIPIDNPITIEMLFLFLYSKYISINNPKIGIIIFVLFVWLLLF